MGTINDFLLKSTLTVKSIAHSTQTINLIVMGYMCLFENYGPKQKRSVRKMRFCWIYAFHTPEFRKSKSIQYEEMKKQQHYDGSIKGRMLIVDKGNVYKHEILTAFTKSIEATDAQNRHSWNE